MPPLNPKYVTRQFVRTNLIPKGGLNKNTQNAFNAQNITSQAQFAQTQGQLNAQPDPTILDPNQQYAHPQPWRLVKHGAIFAHLGAMGTYDSEIIIAIELQTEVFALYDQIFRSHRRRITESMLLDMVKKFVYDPMYTQLHNFMWQAVPSDSGRLLNAMELALSGGRGGDASATSQLHSLHPFFVVLNTGKVPYAKVLAGMGGHVKHPHAGSRNKSWRTGRIIKAKPHRLNDPLAIPDYFPKSVELGRMLARQFWQQFISSIMIPFLDVIVTEYTNAHVRVSAQEVADSLFEVVFQ